MVAMNFYHVPVGSSAVDLIADGDRIVAHLMRGETFEPETLAQWQSICMFGVGMVVDVGAYTGLFSIAAAKCGMLVFAFEPLAANKLRCEMNARHNGVGIRVHPYIVSDRNEVVELTVNPNVEGLTSGASMVRKNGVKLKVKSVTLDAMNFVDLKAIKIDVERAEPLVLRGARKTLKRHKPIVICEVLDDERAAEVERELGLANYHRIKVMDKRNWLCLPK